MRHLTQDEQSILDRALRRSVRIVRRKEFDQFMELQRQFIDQIEDDTLREQMEDAFNRMESLNADR